MHMLAGACNSVLQFFPIEHVLINISFENKNYNQKAGTLRAFLSFFNVCSKTIF